MLRDIWDCARSVWRHWVGLLTGGALMFALGFLQNTGYRIPRTAFWLVALGTLIFAFFKAWRDEHREKEEALAKLSLQPSISGDPALEWGKLYEEKRRLESDLETELEHLEPLQPILRDCVQPDDPGAFYFADEAEYRRVVRKIDRIKEDLEIIKEKIRRSP